MTHHGPTQDPTATTSCPLALALPEEDKVEGIFSRYFKSQDVLGQLSIHCNMIIPKPDCKATCTETAVVPLFKIATGRWWGRGVSSSKAPESLNNLIGKFPGNEQHPLQLARKSRSNKKWKSPGIKTSPGYIGPVSEPDARPGKKHSRHGPFGGIEYNFRVVENDCEFWYKELLED